MAIRYFEQAQGVGAVRSLGPECLRRLPVGLDGRLVTAQAMLAVAEQVEEVCLLMLPLSGRPTPRILRAVLRCHGGPSEDGWFPSVRPASVTNLSTMLISPPPREQAYHSWQMSRLVLSAAKTAQGRPWPS